MTGRERRTILSVANDLRGGLSADVNDDAYWRTKGVADLHDRSGVLGRAQSLVNAEEDYASANPATHTLRGLFDPQYQGSAAWGGPLGTPTATVVMRVEVILPNGGVIWRNIKVNPDWDELLADINADLIEDAQELQKRYGGVDYVLHLETVRIF